MDLPITTDSTISQNNFKETTAILRFEVPLKRGHGNNVIYFPDLINPPKEATNQKIISMDASPSDQQHLENEMALENFVVSETADFLEHMAIEKRPEPKFYAISRKNTTPGFFGAGTNADPPENILQFFKNEQSNNISINTIPDVTGIIENNENKIVNKPIKSKPRKNATTSSRSKGKKIIRQEEKIIVTNEAVVNNSTTSSKKTKRQPSQQSEIKTKKQKTKVIVQKLLEKRKRRKEKKNNKDVSTSSIVSSSSSKNSTPVTKSSKSVKNEDDSSSSSSTESSLKRKDRLDARSPSSSTSSTVTSTKASKMNANSKDNNPNNHNVESSESTVSDYNNTP